MKYYTCDSCGTGPCTLKTHHSPKYDLRCVEDRIRHDWTEIDFETFKVLSDDCKQSAVTVR
jgi:hypothetical protein